MTLQITILFDSWGLARKVSLGSWKGFLYNMDYLKIAEKQDSFYPKKIPLREIPELTYEIWRESINHNELWKRCKDITKDSDAETLSEWYHEMLLCSSIWLDHSTEEKRWKWVVVFDMDNQIYWKLENWIDDSIVMEYWTNWILND